MNPWLIGGAIVAAAGTAGWAVLGRIFGPKIDPDIVDCFRNPSLADYYDSRIPTKLAYQPGVYGWYLDVVPPNVPAEDCLRVGSHTLLYVGVSSGDMARRIKEDHFKGNAEGSTLRRTLGCLQEDELGIQLGRTASGRWTFGRAGEDKLSKWMIEHAQVAWALVRDGSLSWPKNKGNLKKHVLKPVEGALMEEFVLPLNIEGNRKDVCREVKKVRDVCQKRARRQGET